MPYVPDPANPLEPLDNRVGADMPAEFRAIKQYIIDQLALKANSADVPLTADTVDEATVDAKDDAVVQAFNSHLAATYTTTSALNNLIATVKDTLMPVGTLYVNKVSLANPESYLGFGTWVTVPETPGGWERTS